MPVPDDTQVRLLDAAGEVFAERGFEKATVRAIVDRAGLKNLAAVNYYFGDKEALYRRTLEHAFQCRSGEMGAPAWPADMAGFAKLREFIRLVVNHMNAPRQPWQSRLLILELSNPSPAGADLVRRFIRPIYEALWAILREVLPADVPQEKLHLISFSIMGQCFYHKIGRPVLQQVVGPDEYNRLGVDQIADHIADFSEHAVRQLAHPDVLPVAVRSAARPGAEVL